MSVSLGSRIVILIGSVFIWDFLSGRRTEEGSLKVYEYKKFKLPLCWIKCHAMKTWGSERIAPSFLFLALDGSKWSASRFGRFTLGKRVPDTRWVGSRTALDAVEYRKLPCPWRKSNPGRPACCLSLYRLSYPTPKETYCFYEPRSFLILFTKVVDGAPYWTKCLYALL
jgi:hypothetical protein